MATSVVSDAAAIEVVAVVAVVAVERVSGPPAVLLWGDCVSESKGGTYVRVDWCAVLGWGRR